jgi:ribosome-associated heat shock protein Hsp15
MTMENSVRVDKFLWAVRIFKTRSLATDECRKGRVLINNLQVKPSRNVGKDEIISVRKPPVSYTYRVINLTENRVGAKLVENYIENLTPESEISKLILSRAALLTLRDRGTGRPTKKERRNLDKFIDDFQNPEDL